MKKILLLTLTLLLAFSLLTACTTKQSAGSSSESQSASASSESQATSSSSESQPAKSSSEYEKGTFTDNSFESEYLDLRFTLPDGFVMATEEDIATMMGLGAEMMDLDSKLVEYANLTTVYEMMATEVASGTNVIVLAEKLSMSNMTVEQYFTALESQLKAVESIQYEIDNEITTVEIAGNSYKQLTASTVAYGKPMVQKYMLRKIDDRMIGFIVTDVSESEEVLNTLMAGFSKF